MHNAIQPSDVRCEPSLNPISSLLLANTQFWACPEWKCGVRVQADSYVVAKICCLLPKMPLEINLKGLEWNRAEFLVFPACFPLHLCIRVGVFGVWAWVRNAWPCLEEWLLYSCLVGTMGARAVSLGSCMDDLRRSPSFIKHTPTCRIDLAKKRGGNSSSSVFPDHKSLGGVPPHPPHPSPRGRGDTIVSAAVPSDKGKGQGQSPHTYGGSRMARKKVKRICASLVYRNNPGTKKIKATPPPQKKCS